MLKEARKPSSDPIQEKLRQHKAVWNKEVSIFIDNLINLKKLMNGFPSKFNMEKSFIKDPMPADPNSILGVLAGDFQDLAHQGNSIISEQLEYSNKRKKRQNTQPNLSQQLTAEIDFNLEAIASNPFSRFYSKLKGPILGNSPEARIKKYRVSMLNSCADLNRQLRKFEEAILGKSPESIFTASKMLDKIENQVNFILNTISAFKSIIPKKENISSNPKSDIKSIIDDFNKNYLNFTDLDETISRKLINAISNYESATPENEEKIISDIYSLYKELVDDLNRKYGTFAKTLGEILFAKKASIEILAQEFLSKWIKKIIHQLSPFDKTSALRLDIFKKTEESQDILDKMMNSLEKDFDIDSLVNYTNELFGNLTKVKSLMKPLEDIIKHNMFDKTFINLLKDNKITEFDFNFDKKQKERLERLLENRKFRDLSQIYHKRDK